MKKTTLAALLAASVLLMVLLALALYLTFPFRREMESAGDRAAQAESDAEDALQALYASGPSASETEEQTETQETDLRVIWVGDSRTVAIQRAMEQQSQDLFIAAAGEGYNWFAATGLDQLNAAIKEAPSLPVVFNLGVNDYENLELYLNLYHDLLQEYPDTDFWFLSVNPIDPERCSNITNEEIMDFNDHLQSSFPERYLDSCSRLTEAGAETIDGIHYSGEDSIWLYWFVKESLKESSEL